MDVTLNFFVNLVKKGSMFSCLIFLVQFFTELLIGYLVSMGKPHA